MRIYSEDAKTSNISSMLNTYFVASDIQSTTNLGQHRTNATIRIIQ